jgi:hypothetical protein
VGRLGATTPVRARSPTRLIADSTVAHPGTARVHRIVAHRSDRRGATPITWLAIRAVHAIGAPRADIHDGPEP